MIKRRRHSPEIDGLLAGIFGLDDLNDLELAHKLKRVTHLFGHLIGEQRKDQQLSHARMRLLIRLKVDEQLHHDDGITPSDLSRFLGVSRNTVSALLNGLEEQRLAERHPHPTDRRKFRIRITPAGEALVGERAPEYAAFITGLLDPLSADDRAALHTLLDKLLDSLYQKAASMGLYVPHGDPESTEEADE